MKKILLLLAALVSLSAIAQQIDTIGYSAGTTTHKMVRDKLNETVGKVNDHTDTMLLKLDIEDTITLSNRIDVNAADIDAIEEDTVLASTVVVMKSDSVNSSGYTTKSDFNVGLALFEDNTVKAYQAMGSVVKAQSIGLNHMMVTAAGSLTDGRAVFHAIYLPTASTLTGVKIIMATAGAFNQNNYNGFGLYSVSGGTLTLVASTATDSTIFESTAGSVVTKAFSPSTYSAAAGLYYVCVLYNCAGTASVTPQIGSATNGTASGNYANALDFTNSLGQELYIESKTALPTPTIESSTLTPSTLRHFVMVY